MGRGFNYSISWKKVSHSNQKKKRSTEGIVEEIVGVDNYGKYRGPLGGLSLLSLRMAWRDKAALCAVEWGLGRKKERYNLSRENCQKGKRGKGNINLSRDKTRFLEEGPSLRGREF